MVGWIGRLMGHMKKHTVDGRDPARKPLLSMKPYEQWNILHINWWPLDFWTINTSTASIKWKYILAKLYHFNLDFCEIRGFPFQNATFWVRDPYKMVDLPFLPRITGWAGDVSGVSTPIDGINCTNLRTYCWRFRNPARTPPLGCINLVNNLGFQLHLNWWVCRISSNYQQYQ